MAGTRAPFASLAALAAVASAQGEQNGTAAESAKKDLQSLPTVQRPAEVTPAKSLFSGTSAVTGLSLGAPAAPSAPKDKDGVAPGRSPNWLLDGVNQLEAEAAAQREASKETASAANSRPAADGRTSAQTSATTNPFTEYLTQWLSPADQALLNGRASGASSSSTAPWEMPRSEFRPEGAAPSQAASNPFQMELPGLTNFSASRTTQNPYLTEALETENTIFAAKGASASGQDAAALPSILTPSQSALPPVAPVPAQIEQAKAAPTAAPTERLIDDRKYFPQLRRF